MCAAMCGCRWVQVGAGGSQMREKGRDGCRQTEARSSGLSSGHLLAALKFKFNVHLLQGEVECSSLTLCSNVARTRSVPSSQRKAVCSIVNFLSRLTSPFLHLRCQFVVPCQETEYDHVNSCSQRQFGTEVAMLLPCQVVVRVSNALVRPRFLLASVARETARRRADPVPVQSLHNRRHFVYEGWFGGAV
jgi:hypothetical protein